MTTYSLCMLLETFYGICVNTKNAIIIGYYLLLSNGSILFFFLVLRKINWVSKLSHNGSLQNDV